MPYTYPEGYLWLRLPKVALTNPSRAPNPSPLYTVTQSLLRYSSGQLRGVIKLGLVISAVPYQRPLKVPTFRKGCDRVIN